MNGFFRFLHLESPKKMRKSVLLILFSFAVGVLSAQNPVSQFKAEEINGNVYLTWTIQQGFTCNGVDVERSTDSVNYLKIGDIEGICGSSAEEIHYDFTDNFPEKNTRNFYRLSLGGLLYSHFISIDIIDIPANNYLVVPNPFNVNSQIFFENSAYAQCTLNVYLPDGSPVKEMFTSGEVFNLDREYFSSGLYFFRISYDNGKASVAGRFAVY